MLWSLDWLKYRAGLTTDFFYIQGWMITHVGNSYVIKGRIPFLEGQFKEMSFLLANAVFFFLLVFTSATPEYTIQSCKCVIERSIYDQF